MSASTPAIHAAERSRIPFHPADLGAGLAAMLVALPSAIAFGVTIYTSAGPGLAGAGALTGIIGAIALGLVAPLVGRNPGFITAPCAPAAAVLSGLAIDLSTGRKLPPETVLALLALTALISAALQIIYGIVRAGRVIKYIPYQVVSGYLSGVAVIIAVGQFPKLLGVPRGTHFFGALVDPAHWQWPGIVVGCVTILGVALGPRLTTRVPAAILGLTGGIATYFALSLIRPDLLVLEGNRLVIGSITASGTILDAARLRVASLQSISFADVLLVLAPAATLSALLSIDTLKTGVVLDALTHRRHDSNRELVAQGVANVVSFAAGGMPGAGTMGATLVNVTSGSRTIASSVIYGLLALLAFLVLGPLIAWVPIGALAGILLAISWRMFDFEMFRLLRHRETRLDFVIIAAVIVVAEGIGLIEASVVGVCLAIMLFIRDQIQSSVIQNKQDLRVVRSKRRRSPEEIEVLDKDGEQGLLVQLRDDLFFGTTDQLASELATDMVTRRFILLDLRRVDTMDYTTVHLFENLRATLGKHDGELLMCGMPSRASSREGIETYLQRRGLIGEHGVRLFETRDGAIEWMEDRILESRGIVRDANRPPLDLAELAFFKGFDPDALERIRTIVETRALAQGDTLFTQGTSGDALYFVRRGRMRILLRLEGGKRHHVATVASGEMFGEISFIDRGVRSADAEAAVDTQLYVLARSHFDALGHPEITAQMLERIALVISNRLRQTDAELEALEER